MEITDKVRQGFSLLLQDTQRHLHYPHVLNYEASMSQMEEAFAPLEDILYVKGYKTTWKGKESTFRELHVSFLCHTVGGGVFVKEVQLSILSETVTSNWFVPIATVMDKLKSTNKDLSVLFPETAILSEYIMFWLSKDLISLGSGIPIGDEGDKLLKIVSIEAPVWGDERAGVRINLELQGEERAIVVPYHKSR